MAGPALSRKRTLLERHAPWLLFALAATLGVLGVVLVLELGPLEEYLLFPRIVRGYTPSGVLLGLGAFGLMLVAFFYALRKRVLQERLPLGRSTMAAWLWGHVYLGLLALVLAAAHAGYGLVSFEFTSGKCAFYALLALVLSGVVWRVLYAIVPPRAAREVGNYSASATRARADALTVEIEKLSAGVSPRFRELVAWARAARPSESALAQAAASLPAQEQARFIELSGLERTTSKLRDRARLQARYRRTLQGARLLHVPLSLLLIVALPLHVLLAYDAPARVLPLGAVPGADLGGFEPAARCADCHREIVRQWQMSMHAHAMTSPIMVAQNNQVAAHVLADAASPDPKLVCVNCHGPIGTALTGQATLPLSAPLTVAGDDGFLNEGVTCSVCHQWEGTPQIASAGLARFGRDLTRGHVYQGPFVDPVGNAFHQSRPSANFQHPERLCQNCHSVQYDKNGDGRMQRGVDLVLQSLYDEWAEYREHGGSQSCIDCHMPATSNTRAAEAALVPFEQDREAPPRAVRDHSFVATDYPLDDPAAARALAPRRLALLQSAASLSLPAESVRLDGVRLSFSVEVGNVGVGHNLPGGFAFVRQMWLEVSVLGPAGETLASSGQLQGAGADLCDASIVSDANSPVLPFLSGCSEPDRLLVNFQQMLLDVIQVRRDSSGAPLADRRGNFAIERAPGAKEAVIQHLTAGAIPRVRPFDGKGTPPLTPGERRRFAYAFTLSGSRPSRLRVRLLFRSTPPYFLRALAHGQVGAVQPRLEELIPNLEVVEMARVEQAFGAAGP